MENDQPKQECSYNEHHVEPSFHRAFASHEKSDADVRTDHELPMVVWLRGDEDILEQFSVDADQAMTMLGIKRSRLTQISGRELRVGRLRIDRYTRPVYRLSDLDDYQTWTRATASHKSSSKAIDDAVQKLDEQRELLRKTLSEELSDLELQLRRCMNALTQLDERVKSGMKPSIDKALMQLFAMLQESERHHRTINRNAHQTTHDSLAQLRSLPHDLDDLRQWYLKASTEIREISIAVKTLQTATQTLDLKIISEFNDVKEVYTKLFQQMVELRKEFRKESERLINHWQTPAFAMIKPRRQIPKRQRSLTKICF